MHNTPPTIKYLEQVTDLASEMFAFIAEDAQATNSFIETLIAQGYRDDNLFHFHEERLRRAKHLTTVVAHSQKTLKELQ